MPNEILKKIDLHDKVIYLDECAAGVLCGDLENERYATRMTEVFCDKVVKPVIEEGFDFVTEAPIPTVEEINCYPEFYAEIISKEKFEEVYNSKKYMGCIEFPK